MSAQSNPTDPAGREDEDAFNVVCRAELREGIVGQVETYPLPDDAVSHQESQPKQTYEPELRGERDKVHPRLREWLAGRSGDEREQLIVVLADQITIPRFPEPATDEPRESERNRGLLERAQELVRSIEAQRAPGYQRLEASLADAEATLVERFWIINGVVAEMPLKSVERLASREDVVSIEPRFSGEEPPQDEVDDARARLDSDPYFNLGLTGGWIGLLDTGVRFSHTQFTNPSHIDFRRDCNKPEEEFVGVLEAAHPGVGPGNRPSLAFVLKTVNDVLPVYASGAATMLGPLVGPRLRIRGKVVDLTREGGIRELWIATIASTMEE
ncbi:hypothetical protein [Streptomyces sp. NPDC101150]|uniref:hypothetical protein n=1 Tax=Streptomyces sp. NPDC101150 TaxID=3366114 RepID=UPI0038245AFF